MSEMKLVTQQEYEEFIAKYPRTLKIDVCGIIEPPVKRYYDFSLGSQYNAEVAAMQTSYDTKTGKEEPENYRYWIRST